MVNQGQPLCIYDAPEGLLISMHNQGIECLSREEASVELTSVVKRTRQLSLALLKQHKSSSSLILMTIQ